ncbi:uncharacterized protein LAESUDRAFT_728215, partial [Laetiporus sulphureus 93-53]
MRVHAMSAQAISYTLFVLRRAQTGYLLLGSVAMLPLVHPRTIQEACNSSRCTPMATKAKKTSACGSEIGLIRGIVG